MPPTVKKKPSEFRSIEDLWDKIMGDIDLHAKEFDFQGIPSLTLNIKDHEQLTKDLDAPIYGNLIVNIKVNKLIEKLKNCESHKAVEVEEPTPELTSS